MTITLRDIINRVREQTFPNYQPLAASADPDSSRVASEQLSLSGKRDAQKREVLKALRFQNDHHFLPTSRELSERSGIDRHVCGRRMSDLERDGFVERVVDAAFYGNNQVRWRVK